MTTPSSLLNAIGPSGTICEVSEAIPIVRNSIFIGISDLPAHIGIVEGLHCRETTVSKGDVLPVNSGSWITLSGPPNAQLLRIEVRDEKILVSQQNVSDPKAPSAALALAPIKSTEKAFKKISSEITQLLRMNGGQFPATSGPSLEKISILLFQIFAEASSIEKQSQAFGQRFTDTAAHYVRSNLGRNIRRPEIANYCDISESYLTLLIRKNLGLSLTDLISLMRAFLAFEYIVGSNLKISTASKICGFSSNNYFIRAYRTLNGLTPLQVRKLYHRSSLKSVADHYAIFKLKGFTLIEPVNMATPSAPITAPEEPQYPFAVANTTKSPALIYQRSKEGQPIAVTETWIPPGRNRIVWSSAGAKWQAEDVEKGRSLGVFRTPEKHAQTLLLV